jgi:tRNA-dihydrouridine synthase B
VTDLNLKALLKDLEDLVNRYRSEIQDYYDLKNRTQTDLHTGEKQSYPIDYIIEKRSFRIGDVLVINPVISAPLAGISDNTYRIFAKAFGSALNYSEMVSSYGLFYNHRDSLALASISDYERPCGIQIFGSEPEIMLDAALRIENYADFIDINMGCPVPKVIKTKSGGYLLKDEKRISRIITKITAEVKKPLTIKVRLGWDKNSINAWRVAKIAEDCGAAAIAVHGRTVRQGFSGNVEYETIKKVKEGVNIPVMVSGDIDSFNKAKYVLELTSCDAVMIGRSSKGTPWLFFNMVSGFEGLELNDFCPSLKLKKDLASLYLRFMIYFKGEEKAVKEFRKFIAWIFKGIKGISRSKQDFFSVATFDDAIEQIAKIESV